MLPPAEYHQLETEPVRPAYRAAWCLAIAVVIVGGALIAGGCFER